MFRLICCVALCTLLSTLCAEDKRPWLGITPDTTTGFESKVTVGSVKPKSTAEEMGLQAKDIITDFASDKNSWRINGVDDLSDALNQHQPGDAIRIGIERGEEKLTFKGVLKERPTSKNLSVINKANQEKLKELASLKGKGNANAALALAMHGLNKTLEQLPEKIEEAAREFKKVYPDGEFVLKVEISISSNKLDAEDDPDTEKDGGKEAENSNEQKDPKAVEDKKKLAPQAEKKSDKQSKNEPAGQPDKKAATPTDKTESAPAP